VTGSAAVTEIVAVIPVKGLAKAKSRLSDRLTPAERAQLVLHLLDRVLAAVFASALVQRCLVVSPDPLVRTSAEAAGAVAVDEATPGAGQNAALEHARRVARRWNPTALLVLSGDLPLLTPQDLEMICRLGAEDGTVVVAPDRPRTGTNALHLRPPDLLPFRFGAGSFRQHVREARDCAARIRAYYGSGTAFDLDVPEDLDLIQRIDPTFKRTDPHR